MRKRVCFLAFGVCFVLAGCGGETMSGSDGGDGGQCQPHASMACSEATLYWQDSCGNREQVIEICDCGCDPSVSDCVKPCDCVPQCDGRCCGDNGCGGVCRDDCAAGTSCDPTSCTCTQDCEPATCASLGKECGSWDDGCGGTIDCGQCSSGQCTAEGLCGCEEGRQRCNGNALERCQSGEFVEVERCGAGEVCSAELGCIVCDPGAGNFCFDGDVYACNPDGSRGQLVETCWTEPCVEGQCGDPACPPETMFVYVVDDSYRLLSFNPADTANPFRLIGNLDCPAGPSWPEWGGGTTATPFSMSVDRSGRAWVLYTSGEIFWVSTTDASCQVSPYPKGQSGYKLFGMGFVTDSAGSDTEKLYIAGGNVDAQVMGNMAYIDPNTLSITTLGPCPQAEYGPELTGTGKGEWYGYFPGTSSSFVAKLNKQTGQIEHQWQLPRLSGTVRAWAFAHWGGKFYIFVTTYSGSYRSQVLRLDPQTGSTDTFLDNLPYIIVGAGVSTCAPYQ
ncbi:MAG: hypothetical protein D6806_03880 [Deltaproteobacteria bacterium]|nr:MAG: hypothetical protein D6806_03880 [Deltaproteobacteria bacterium]